MKMRKREQKRDCVSPYMNIFVCLFCHAETLFVERWLCDCDSLCIFALWLWMMRNMETNANMWSGCSLILRKASILR